MPIHPLYVWKDGRPDRSRWVGVARRGRDLCSLHLGDLCQPGKSSRFTSVTLPIEYLRSTLERGGSLQVTLATGYLLVQVAENKLRMEFRAREEAESVKASFLASELLVELNALERPSPIALVS